MTRRRSWHSTVPGLPRLPTGTWWIVPVAVDRRQASHVVLRRFEAR